MSEYVPTVPDVNGIRGSWACAHIRGDITPEQAIEAFDQWLASVKAQALRDAAAEIVQAGDVAYKSPISWLRWRAIQIQEGHTA